MWVRKVREEFRKEVKFRIGIADYQNSDLKKKHFKIQFSSKFGIG